MRIHLTTFSASLIVAALCTSGLLAQATDTAARDREAMRSVAMLLEGGHLTAHELDDAISRRAFDAYLDAFDPRKLYFDQSDVDEFAKHRDELDDMLRRGDPRFAHRVFARFLERVDERTALAEELVGSAFDFGVDEQIVTDPEATRFAQDEAESHERWRKPVKYDSLALYVDGVDAEKAEERLRQRYGGFRRQMRRLERDEIVALFVTCLSSSFDPHSSYMGAHALENFNIQMSLGYEGIGALLDDQDGEAVIERIMPGGPAEKHGELKNGDRIISVGEGESGPMTDVVGWRLRDIVRLIRGESGSTVRLSIISKGDNESRVVAIQRGHTELQEQAARSAVFDHTTADKNTIKVGVIDLPSFYSDLGAGSDTDQRSATRDVRRILRQFADQGVDVAVLDLRRNGGGYLTEAVDVAGLFVDTAPVVQIKGIDGRVEMLADRDESVAWDGELVVLSSKFSASASEIVAGAIQDWGRGVVVGDSTSHGKGTVQRVVPLDRRGEKPRLGALKLTIQKFYRPSGRSTQRRGVDADVTLPSLTDSSDFGEARLPHALPFDEIDAVSYPSLGRIDANILRSLAAASSDRRKDSADLQELERRIVVFNELSGRTNMPLEEQRYRSLREQLESSERDRRELGQQDETDETIRRDAYLDEAIAIAADYATLARAQRLARESDRAPKRRRKGG